jgi:putative endonuclease
MPAALKNLSLNLQRRTLLQLQALAHRLGRSRPLPAHLRTGLRGEFEALFFLRRLGYTVTERRWHAPDQPGDLDLIAWETVANQPFLCFIEVKTRTARDLTPAALAVDSGKRRVLRRMARAYLRTLPRGLRRDTPIRFDLVSVYLLPTGAECELIRGIDIPR